MKKYKLIRTNKIFGINYNLHTKYEFKKKMNETCMEFTKIAILKI